jgi:hypothetical protein
MKMKRILILFLSILTVAATGLIEPKLWLGFSTEHSTIVNVDSDQSHSSGSCGDSTEFHPCHFGHCSFVSILDIRLNLPEKFEAQFIYRFWVPTLFLDSIKRPPDSISS